MTADGSRVLTIRIRSNPQAERLTDWDEQHIVTAPDGVSTVFETSGLTQTIRDGDTGEVLGRSRLTAQGAVPEAFMQSARGPLHPPKELQRFLERAAARTIEAALSLFAVLSSRNSQDRTAVFAAPASNYLPGDMYNERAVWAGVVNERDLDRFCPRNAEVQDIARRVAAGVRRVGGYTTEQQFGNRVHKLIADIVNGQNNPDFVTETSYSSQTGAVVDYGTEKSIRVDVLEKADESTVCVYDHKTGKTILRATRATDIISVIQKRYPGMRKYIMIEVRPEP